MFDKRTLIRIIKSLPPEKQCEMLSDLTPEERKTVALRYGLSLPLGDLVDITDVRLKNLKQS